MNQPAKSHEPSMEEILASIRRIIADDDIPKSPQPHADLPPARPVMAAPPPASEPEPIFEAPPPMPEAVDRGFDPMMEESQPAPEDAVDILELTEEMRAPEPPATAFRTIDAQPDIMFAELAPEPAPPPPPMMMEEPPAMMTAEHLENARQTLAEQMMDRPLLSSSASAAVDTAFNSLAHTVLSQNARTLDDLVKDMLRPMLKSWLDDNLPGLVERLVRAEIERVSRGR
jgi:cell pole-organizing protein PopZ